MLPVTEFFVRKAEAALSKAANRAADLHFFEQVLARLKSGEDLSHELAAFKNEEIILHCRSGARSGNAKMFLLDSGFTNVRNLLGGMLAWKEKY